MKELKSILGAAAVLLALLVLIGLFRASQAPLNVLLLTLDTTRADHLGCYGWEHADTPALDALAASGVTFTRAFCNAPVALPSHATMLTGLYPPEHGCRVNGVHALADGVPTLAQVFAGQGYRTAAFTAAFVLHAKFGLDRGFQTYDDRSARAVPGLVEDGGIYEYRRADRVADAVLAWLGSRPDGPFFCWVHFFDPHRPYAPASAAFGRGPFREYDGEIAFMDSQIARIIGCLDREKLLDRTVIIAMGDHGEGLGEHGEIEHGMLLYNSALHVPLIVRHPRCGRAGSRVDTLVSGVDLFPTVLAMFGWTARGHLSGRSFLPALRGKPMADEPFYIETDFPLYEFDWSPLRAVMTADRKYIRAPREELYDLAADPRETNNLAAGQTALVGELRALLASFEAGMTVKAPAAVTLDEASRRNQESPGDVACGGQPAAEGAERKDPKDKVWMQQMIFEAGDAQRRGDTARAEEIIRGLIEQSPESYTFRSILADILWRNDRLEEARRECEEMVRLAPDQFRTHYHLGNALMKLESWEEAIREFEAALAIDPRHFVCQNCLGLALVKTGRTEEAMAAFRRSIAAEPDQVEAHNNLGGVLLSLNRPDEAMREFNRALQVDPDHFESRFNLGVALLRLTRYSEAARQFEYALDLQPGFPEAQRRLNEALLNAGRSGSL